MDSPTPGQWQCLMVALVGTIDRWSCTLGLPLERSNIDDAVDEAVLVLREALQNLKET